MSWKEEIRKNDGLEKRYEIAYKNFESEVEALVFKLRDVMNRDFDRNAILAASNEMDGRYGRAFDNMQNLLKRVEDKKFD
tara:strand:- start:549 stop:788 length:240 start_codon:yes stop_codon:yes gene_type:complete